MEKRERWIKGTVSALAAAFALVTAAMLLASKQPDRLALAVGTVFLALVPWGMERLFRCRIHLAVYLFAVAYGIGPMLGHCWYLYYTVPCWDKLLHICGGVMFAILGVWLFDRLIRRQGYRGAGVLFALCFSIAVAAVWEFAEFGADVFLGMDMQDDTVILSLRSYLLGDRVGVTGTIPHIRTVSINGQPLPVEGYIDIGLIDTMLDMLLESLGAIAACAALWLDRGRHTLIEDPPRS